MQPTYEHDCTRCHFLGQHTDNSGTLYDLYYHPEPSETLIGRYSSEGSNYTSGSFFGRNAEREGNLDHPLYRALLLAREQGLIVPKTYYLAESTDYFAEHWDALEKHPYFKGKPRLEAFTTPAMDDDAFEDGMDRHDEAVKAYDTRWQEEHGELPLAPPEGLTLLCKSREEALRWAGAEAIRELTADNDEHARELTRLYDEECVRKYRRALLRS